MRILRPSSPAMRYALALLALLAAAALPAAVRKYNFTTHDKAYYADPSVIEYVQPGLTFTVVSASIASDGTIKVDYKVTDASGAALDQTGVLTPGTVSPRFAIAYIKSGTNYFTDYFTSSSTNATTGFVATRASADSGGTTQTVATGEYIYTFGGKAPSGYDVTATHRIGIYGSRNLTQWDLGTSYGDTFYDFVPNGNKVTVTRDVVRNAACNKCHDSLAFHGGSRRSVQVCVICHQPQMSDTNGQSADFKVMVHKIHMGSELPSVVAGGKYALGSTDWSTVAMPSDIRRCAVCHDSAAGATQNANWYSNPSRAACGSCHDDVNFATGAGHVNLPQFDDSQCSQCHIPKGTVDFDASIQGAHLVPEDSTSLAGINFTLTKVTNGTSGNKPTVTFTAKDNSGNAIAMSSFSSISMTMSGPTTDYGNTSFGSDVTTPGYVTESIKAGAVCGSDGTCTYSFTHAIPAAAAGTFAIGIEGRISATLLAGTVKQTTFNYAGTNQVIYFSVDGSTVAPRRAPVALANCNKCHFKLELHGTLRNNVTYCVMCHNPNGTDSPTRPASTVTADRALPNQGINFAMMAHKIHTGVNLQTNFNQSYVIVGFGGSHNDFSDVRYPAMSPTGAVHDTTNCSMCHVNGAEAVLPVGKLNVLDPQGLLSPSPATTSACTACHLKTAAFAHASSQTDPKFGESCDVCHGTGAEFDATKVHAGQ